MSLLEYSSNVYFFPFRLYDMFSYKVEFFSGSIHVLLSLAFMYLCIEKFLCSFGISLGLWTDCCPLQVTQSYPRCVILLKIAQWIFYLICFLFFRMRAWMQIILFVLCLSICTWFSVRVLLRDSLLVFHSSSYFQRLIFLARLWTFCCFDFSFSLLFAAILSISQIVIQHLLEASERSPSVFFASLDTLRQLSLEPSQIEDVCERCLDGLASCSLADAVSAILFVMTSLSRLPLESSLLVCFTFELACVEILTHKNESSFFQSCLCLSLLVTAPFFILFWFLIDSL